MSDVAIYVIGPNVGPQKIGIARDPSARLAAMQTGCPFTLRIQSVTYVASEDSARRVERVAHRLLKKHRQRGEWFNVTPGEAERAIADALASAEPPTTADGLHWLYAHKLITFDQLEAGLAYREVRREAAKDGMGRGSRTAAMMERRLQAARLTHAIEGEVTRAVGIGGARSLLAVAYKAESSTPAERADLRRALDVVSRLLEHTTSAKAA